MEPILNDSQFLLSVLETMSDGLMVVDKNAKIVYFNPAAEVITGYKKEDVIGTSCSILHTSTCNLSSSSKCNLFAEGCVKNKKCEIIKKDGSIVYLLKNAVVLRDEQGNIKGAVEVMTDVTTLYHKEYELEELKQELRQESEFMGIIGKSTPILRLIEQIKNAATSNAPVIICGESGTGKELVAEAIHKLSNRNKYPFIKVNCAALNEFLLESELFGHVKGAFTGAFKDRAGRFEAAHNGSIFLDEIADMSLNMQAKLLRVLQEKEFERVGDHKPIKVDVRLISATNQSLDNLISTGKFREDLFYRINVIPINTPALKERRDDIALLIQYYLKKAVIFNGKKITNISPSAMDALEAYSWPGNVRQLINAVEYAVMTCRGDSIQLHDLPEYIFIPDNDDNNTFNTKNASKKLQIIKALTANKWNRTKTASQLGISRVSLWKMMKDLNISQ